MLQWGRQAPATPAISGLLKLSLQPLWTSFALFAKKKTELRQKALAGCDVESQHYHRLVESSPFTPDLFDKVEVDKLKDQAAHQSKSILQLLDFRVSSKRKSSGSRASRAPKKARTQHQQPPQLQQQTPYRPPSPQFGAGRGYGRRPANFGPYQQGSYQDVSQSYDNRRGQVTPRGRGKGRGGRARSPGTPRRQAPAASKQNF